MRTSGTQLWKGIICSGMRGVKRFRRNFGNWLLRTDDIGSNAQQINVMKINTMYLYAVLTCGVAWCFAALLTCYFSLRQVLWVSLLASGHRTDIYIGIALGWSSLPNAPSLRRLPSTNTTVRPRRTVLEDTSVRHCLVSGGRRLPSAWRSDPQSPRRCAKIVVRLSCSLRQLFLCFGYCAATCTETRRGGNTGEEEPKSRWCSVVRRSAPDQRSVYVSSVTSGNNYKWRGVPSSGHLFCYRCSALEPGFRMRHGQSWQSGMVWEHWHPDFSVHPSAAALCTAALLSGNTLCHCLSGSWRQKHKFKCGRDV